MKNIKASFSQYLHNSPALKRVHEFSSTPVIIMVRPAGFEPAAFSSGG